MATSRLRRWGRSLGVVIPREEVLRKGLKAGQQVEVSVEALAGPDDFSDLAGTVTWRRDAQAYKDELRRISRT
ncbi:MAG TPA: AbrB/MazE/SpoVT family DNA-binding domain-containing protein [Thermoplasmata archaeon]|nr:AbrB/MazE/SpoVT family DNA-binding domain-containing protein [Thermoplasmata archaeon]